MPYISRNRNNQIESLSNTPEHDQSEWLDVSNPEVLAFVLASKQEHHFKDSLSETDLQMSRVVEDLIELLMLKKTFLFTELPGAVQHKLGTRRQLREHMNSLSNLIDDGDIL